MAGTLKCESLLDEVISSLQASHLRGKMGSICVSHCLDRWNELPNRRNGLFWRKLHNFLVRQAAADMLVHCSIDEDLRKKMERALRSRKVLYKTRGKEFSTALMRRYCLGALLGDSIANPIDMFAIETLSSKTAINNCDLRFKFFALLPIEIRNIIYEYVLITLPLKPGGPRFRGTGDQSVTSLL
jgi:hypothetical protein